MVIKEKIYINTNELGNNVGELCRKFTYKNPEYAEKKRLKLSVQNTDEFLFHYKIENVHQNKMLILPRGGLKRIKDFFEQRELKIKIVDKRISHKNIDCKLIKTKLEDQQKQIIETLIDNEGGLIEAVPGGGKTISILGLIDKIKQPTLIIVHEHRLSSQWISEIKKRLNGNFTLGELNGEKQIDGDIVVGIINTIYRIFQEKPSYFDKFGMIVCDEVHHLPANMMLTVVNNFPAKYRMGVTGTVKRRDGKHILIYDVLGEKLLDIGAEDIKHRVTGFEFKVINTNIYTEIPTIFRWTGRKREQVLDIAKCIGLLVDNTERNNLIIKEVSDLIENGYYPLILSDRVEHNKRMHEHLTELGYKSVLLIGETRKKAKWEDIRSDTSIQCIVANTKIASEALDLPNLSAIVLTCPSSNLPQIKQRVGRIRRHVDGKKLPLVIDICDNLAYFRNDYGEVVNLLQILTTKRINFYKKLIKEYGEEEQTVV